MARRQAALDELSKTHGESIIAMACDGGDGAAVIEFATKVKSRLGVPDLIINSAGAGQWLELEDTSPAVLSTMLDAPFRSAFHVSQAFVKEMISRGSGRILHINSPACILPWAGCTGYAATRFALRGLNEAMHADLSGTGVTTCNVIFGEVSSEYFEANPDSRHKLPTIAKLIPVMTLGALRAGHSQIGQFALSRGHRPIYGKRLHLVISGAALVGEIHRSANPAETHRTLN